ncbi:hypothetical protein THASP1DRAFT_25014 [Thamnocephalis sphaerospora]|uniref:Uncharacterized protein n=1 Tax=Thamnocephalis sphaerospora TaxID=78915 RepID=A0A4P9XLI2_9FUNG|nr:hypothetical protein THASP1DRAFT_25014 [Thamnocephalis sphaerospora]|eukprot:RKP06727.1 hypothetical protein THASP1DRAFT_25014 [Thamnocephalis sphaerospora]
MRLHPICLSRGSSGRIDRSQLLKEGWEKNATYLWGIPLHPMGELNAMQFLMEAQGDKEEMRLRRNNMIVETILNVVATYIFAHNALVSLRILRRQKYVLAGWCCLLQAVAGLVYTLPSLYADFPDGPCCRQALWIAGFGISVSTICVGITLLQKAYLVHDKNKWLLTAGTILLFPQPIITYYTWTSPAAMVPSAGCLLLYPPELPWIKLALDAPINIIFSVAFIIVVYRQYHLFGSAAWARLVRDGIQTMCIIVLSNLVCMLCVVFEAAGPFSQLFFVFDWLITSVLLRHHLSTLCSASSVPHRPTTAHMLQGFSKIATAAPEYSKFAAGGAVYV